MRGTPSRRVGRRKEKDTEHMSILITRAVNLRSLHRGSSPYIRVKARIKGMQRELLTVSRQRLGSPYITAKDLVLTTSHLKILLHIITLSPPSRRPARARAKAKFLLLGSPPPPHLSTGNRGHLLSTPPGRGGLPILRVILVALHRARNHHRGPPHSIMAGLTGKEARLHLGPPRRKKLQVRFPRKYLNRRSCAESCSNFSPFMSLRS